MIILDHEDQRKRFQVFQNSQGTLRLPEKVAIRSESPLPDYETSEARQKLIEQAKKLHKGLDPKLWKAVLYALGIYILLSIVIGVPIVVVKTREESRSNFVGAPWAGNAGPGAPISVSNANAWLSSQDAKCEWKLIPDEDPADCTFKATYFLNYSGSLFIRSNVTASTSSSTTNSVGNLTVDVNPDPKVSKVVFQLVVETSTRELLHKITACFDDVGDDKGLFIFAARPLSGMDFVNVTVQVLLPNITGGGLDNFVTYLPSFSHNFGNLGNHVTFNNVLLEGSGYDVVSKSLKACSISVKNNYGSITGKFHATNSLSLSGIKGNIITNATLARNSATLNPTYLSLDTGDGSIDAWVTLVAPTPSAVVSNSAPYGFVANVQTFNGPLDVRMIYAPTTPSTPLQLSVQNSDGATNVVLDQNIEGTFTVQSKLEKVDIQPNHPLPSADPNRLSRTWSIQKDQVLPNRVLGWVGWGNRPAPGSGVIQSQITVLSSLSSIILQLGHKH